MVQLLADVVPKNPVEVERPLKFISTGEVMGILFDLIWLKRAQKALETPIRSGIQRLELANSALLTEG